MLSRMKRYLRIAVVIAQDDHFAGARTLYPKPPGSSDLSVLFLSLSLSLSVLVVLLVQETSLAWVRHFVRGERRGSWCRGALPGRYALSRDACIACLSRPHRLHWGPRALVNSCTRARRRLVFSPSSTRTRVLKYDYVNSGREREREGGGMEREGGERERRRAS